MKFSNLSVHVPGDKILDLPSLGDSVNCAQICIGSPQKWTFKPFSPEVEDIIRKMISRGFKFINHLPYTMNFASLEEDFTAKNKWNGMKHCFAKYIDYALTLGITDHVFHAGSWIVPPKDGVDLESEAIKVLLNRILSALTLTSVIQGDDTKNVKIHIEGKSGGGTSISNPHKIAEGIKNSTASRIFGLCLDLVHAYGAGFDFYDEVTLSKLKDEITVCHFNFPDVKVVFGRHLDRHNTVFEKKWKFLQGFTTWTSLITMLKGIPCIIESDYDVALLSKQVLELE